MKRHLTALTLTLMLLSGFAVLSGGTASAQSPPPCVYSCPVPTAGVGDPTTSVGRTVIVTGQNWCPGSTVTIYLNGVQVGTAIVAADGTFSTVITIPDGFPPGPATVTVTGSDGTCTTAHTIDLPIVVLSRDVTNPPNPTLPPGGIEAAGGNLPFTGGNFTRWMLILSALLVVGVATVVAGRRRRSATEH